MGRPPIEYGEGILAGALRDAGQCLLVTTENPLALLEAGGSRPPQDVLVNRDMSVENLDRLERDQPNGLRRIVGFGGGSSCDTAKYLAWKWKLPLIIAPSVLSSDAWLCRPVAVRDDGHVRYVGDAVPHRLIVDFDLIRKAPPALNRAGAAEVTAIATALGDWKIARAVFGESIDRPTFNAAKEIANEMLLNAVCVRNVTVPGIRALVNGMLEGVELCELWGSTRPVEGGEHQLAHCLEEITRERYVHGSLIALNTLIVMRLQGEDAEFDWMDLKGFFDDAGVEYQPRKQGIRPEHMRQALESVQEYVRQECCFKGLWSQKTVFTGTADRSIDGIMDWVYSF